MATRQKRRENPNHKVLARRRIRSQRKNFVVSAEENERGKFVKITKMAYGDFSSVIIPEDSWKIFKIVLDKYFEQDYEPAPKPQVVIDREGDQISIQVSRPKLEE